MEPVTFLDGRVTLRVGDCRAVLAAMPADSIDSVVTSPPYWGLRDYGVVGQLGMERSLGEHLAVMVDVFREVRRVLKSNGSLWLNYGDCYATSPNGRSAAATKAAGNDDRTFRDKPFSTIGPIYRGKRMPRGAGRWGGGNNSDPTLKAKDLCLVANRLAIALQEDGWWVRSEIVWGKPNAMPDSSGRWRPATAHEKIYLLSKTGEMYYDAPAVRLAAAYANSGRMSAPKEALDPTRKRNGEDGNAASFRAIVEERLLRNYEPDPFQVWHLATAAFEEAHFATFPPDLSTLCIVAGCPKGGVVLDPFAGAGTVGLSAAATGRRAELIELNPEYARLAQARIEAAYMGKAEGAHHMVRRLGQTDSPGPLFAEAV